MPKTAPKKASARKKKPTNAPERTKKPTPVAGAQLPRVTELFKLTLSTILRRNKLILRLALLAWVVTLLITGNAYMSYYGDLSQSTGDVTGTLDEGAFKNGVEVFALLISLLSGAANGLLTEGQQIYLTLCYLLLWLVMVWLLRHILNDAMVTLRDGLYNATAPLIPTIGLVAVACLQLVPLALLISLFATITVNGVLVGMWWTSAFFVVTLLAAAGTLYWIIGTLVSLIVVTIPGTYPIAALRSARTIVRGYRRELLGKIVALLLGILAFQIVVMVPVIVFDALTGYSLPWLVAAVYQLVLVASYIFGGSYVYLLYRRLIDERS